ncbi:MAG: lytic murein transglycosylase [Hyphomicrobiaceae bacterium]
MSVSRHLVLSTSLAATLVCLPAAIPSAAAASCGNGPGGFNKWLASYKIEARRKGISGRTISRALNGITYNPRIIRLDRGQRSFKQSFAKFYARRASPWLLNKARKKMKRHARLLARVEKRYGVPPAVIVTIWGMESNFGNGGGKLNIVRSLATLAYDCRRSAFFTNELQAALKIIQRGDMTPKQMRGGWAGEIGQTQFLASSYVKYAVDFDGNGRRDLIRSVPDVLASTANFLKRHGWQRGQGWQPGSTNFAVLKQWNRATVYQRTIAKAAGVLAGRS